MQKDLLRDLLRVAAENTRHLEHGRFGEGIFTRAIAEESLLNKKNVASTAVPDIPEKLVTHSMLQKKMHKGKESTQPEGLAAFRL